MVFTDNASQETHTSNGERHSPGELEKTGDAIIDIGLDSKTPTAVNTAPTRKLTHNQTPKHPID
jgi:hypothetical protein